GPDETIIDGAGRGPVVTAQNIGSSARLEGFTITGGVAENGGGMLNVSSSPVITHCVFRGNSASSHGGGMFNDDSSPTITDCAFVENEAVRANAGGGGIYNVNGSSPTLEDCSFSRNTAWKGFGGGMANTGASEPVLVNVSFSDNRASSGGGLRNEARSDATLSRVTFSANQAELTGGAIENVQSNPSITDCTFSANIAGRGGGIYNDSSHPEIASCTFSANKAGRSGALGSLNALEGGLWLIFAAVSLILVLTSCRRCRLLFALLVPLLLIIGAGSDFLEAIGGAWWAPDWILLTKAICGVALIVLLVWYTRLHRSPATHAPSGA
ncbi:MAG: right-handed parallel beta-helix repeat-containing protein, partial [Planctomycetota bacterium]